TKRNRRTLLRDQRSGAAGRPARPKPPPLRAHRPRPAEPVSRPAAPVLAVGRRSAAAHPAADPGPRREPRRGRGYHSHERARSQDGGGDGAPARGATVVPGSHAAGGCGEGHGLVFQFVWDVGMLLLVLAPIALWVSGCYWAIWRLTDRREDVGGKTAARILSAPSLVVVTFFGIGGLPAYGLLAYVLMLWVTMLLTPFVILIYF